ncbi:GMC family oxidoreductase N-terminal domain-containing protein [Mesorhizobium sp. ArgA1]
MEHPQGRLLSGSSSINGMAYTRGNVLDFDNWADQYGCIVGTTKAFCHISFAPSIG